MAVCNIFKELKNNTGTFLMFSQYVEDLTRESTQSSYYHITPSKFIALDIDYKDFKNKSIVRLFQDNFENGCAVCRRDMEDWTPNHSTNLFWDTVFSNNLLSKSEFVKEMRYVGDINIQSYNEHDGIGYSEIYCYIPNEAKEYRYGCSVSNKGKTYFSGQYIEGYDRSELGEWGEIEKNIEYRPHCKYLFSWEDNSLTTTLIERDSYDINTIIVLYDIVSKTDNGVAVVYKNVPMGIYFTGDIEHEEMTNKITKYVSSSDIFGTGTGYGLRICSRFTVSPNQNNIKCVDIETSGDYAALSQIMTQMSVSQSKMDDVLTKIQSNTSAEKELLSIFKNSRTNVPYIKDINGKNYWFVNGRCLGSAEAESDECVPYDDIEIIDMLNKAFNLIVNLTALNEEGRYVFDYSTEGPQDIFLNWETLYKNRKIVPEALFLSVSDSNGVMEEELERKLIRTVMNDVYETTTYTIKSEYDGLKASADATVHFVWPTYFGTMQCDASCGNGLVHTFNPLERNIIKLDKYVNIDNKGTYKYTNITRSNGKTDHVVLAYPTLFGPLTSITDEWGYEYIDDFTVLTKTINYNGKNVDYFVYVDKIPAEVYDFTLSFK